MIFQKKKISKILFIVDRSTLLFTDTVHIYCSRVLFTVLFTGTVGHNTKNCIATHFQQPLVVLQYNFLSLVVLQYNFLSLVVLQYNLHSLVVLQYNFLSMLQYNLTPPAIHFLPNQLHNLAIQSTVLQYNFQSSSLILCNTKIVLQYNPLLLHIQGHYITIQCLYYNTKISFHNITWAVAQNCSAQKKFMH